MISSEATSLSSKGQVVIPVKIRKFMKLVTGSKLVVMTDGSNLLLKPIEEPRIAAFKNLISESRRLTRKSRLRKRNLAKIIRKVRSESRS
jgi:AbrB family looped-hinge helix DNA binding protein